MSLPKARLWPATDEAMQSRELVSMLAVPKKPLHELVGGVIVLGQQLAGDVEGDGVRSVPGDDLAKALGHRIERARPTTRDGRRSRDGAAGLRATASRPAPRPWSRAGRDWPDGPGRQRSRRRPARRAWRRCRSRRRSRDRWCGWQSSPGASVDIALVAAGLGEAVEPGLGLPCPCRPAPPRSAAACPRRPWPCAWRRRRRRSARPPPATPTVRRRSRACGAGRRSSPPGRARRRGRGGAAGRGAASRRSGPRRGSRWRASGRRRTASSAPWRRAPRAPRGRRGTARCRCPGPTMMAGALSSAGGAKPWLFCTNTGTTSPGLAKSAR